MFRYNYNKGARPFDVSSLGDIGLVVDFLCGKRFSSVFTILVS